MPPDGVDKWDVNLAKLFASAEPAVHFVVQNGVVAQPDHRVARIAFGERAPDDYVTRLNGVHANLMKSVGRYVLQIEILAAHPPTVGSLEVGKSMPQR